MCMLIIVIYDVIKLNKNKFIEVVFLIFEMHLSIRKPRYDNGIAKGSGICAWKYCGPVAGNQTSEGNYRRSFRCNYTVISPTGCDINGPSDVEVNRWKTRSVGYVPAKLKKSMPDIVELDHLVGNHVEQMKARRSDKPTKLQCDCNLRFLDNCCNGFNEQSSRNVCGCEVDSWDRIRTIDHSKRTSEWCNAASSAYCKFRCGYRNSNPCPFRCTDFANVHCPIRKFHFPSTQRVMDANNKHYGDLENNFQQLCKELNCEIDRLECSTQKLQELLRNLENNLEFTDVPLAVNRHNFDQHKTTFYQSEEVIETLCKEKQVIFKGRELLDCLRQKSQTQLQKNCYLGNKLSDLLGRERQPRIRNINCVTTETTKMGFHPGIFPYNENITSPETWQTQVLTDLNTSYDQRWQTDLVAAEICKLLRDFNNDLWMRVKVTDNAYSAHLERKRVGKQSLVESVEQSERARKLNAQVYDSLKLAQNERKSSLAKINRLQKDRKAWSGFEQRANSYIQRLARKATTACEQIKEIEGRLDETIGNLNSFDANKQQCLRLIASLDLDVATDTRQGLQFRKQVCIDPKGPPQIERKSIV